MARKGKDLQNLRQEFKIRSTEKIIQTYFFINFMFVGIYLSSLLVKAEILVESFQVRSNVAAGNELKNMGLVLD